MKTAAIRVTVLWCLLPFATSLAEEGTWRIRGQFVALDAGEPPVAVFEVGAGEQVRVPLTALADEERVAVLRLADPAKETAVVANPAQSLQRLTHAIDLLKIGNGQLARQELRESSKLDETSGAAEFVTGLAYVFVSRNFPKASEHFREAVKREPKHAYAVANLAVCEVQEKQYAAAAAHFRRALELCPKGQPIADNIGLIIQAAGAGRLKLSAKTLGELNDLYRAALTDQQLAPLPAASARDFLVYGLDGTAVELRAPDGLAKLLAAKLPTPPSGAEP